jgi:class 3 adenylate cyclase
MESHGIPGSIQISRATYDIIREDFVCDRRGIIDMKGMGETETYFLLARRNGEPTDALAAIEAAADLD